MAAAPTGYESRITNEGLHFVSIPLERGGISPLREIRTYHALVHILRRIKPDLIHNVTIKPILYGSLAAKRNGSPDIVNAISGLGYTFLAQGWKARLSLMAIRYAYKYALSGDRMRAIFQNQDDVDSFISGGLIEKRNVVTIRGSGVDVARFVPSPEPAGVPIVMLASRLLRDKGVWETVQAARLLREWKIRCRIVFVGDPDPENRASVTGEELESWVQEGCIEWWGFQSDMARILSQAAIVVLPSYGEGLPKVLIEAAAVGRPIIATDVPGCREVVRHGENGLLVPPRDHLALAKGIRFLVERPDERARMGTRGREIAVDEFRIETVVGKTMAVYRALLKDRYPRFLSETVR